VAQLEPVTHLNPNEHGDWLNQRHDDFEAFLPVGDKSRTGVFGMYTKGLNTARASWVYNSSKEMLERSLRTLANTYERSQATAPDGWDRDETLIKWSRTLEDGARRGLPLVLDTSQVRRSMFRPFFAQYVYFDRLLNDQWYSLAKAAPLGIQPVGFYCVGMSSEVPFGVIMIADLPDLHTTGAGSAGQFFARWRYEKVEPGDGMLAFDHISGDEVSDGYRRIDNITDEALARFRAAYGEPISTDDVFHYVYGLLHSLDYRETYAADLKKMLPRIPLVTDAEPLIDAGRRLSDLHLGYESVTPFPLAGLDDLAQAGDAAYEHFRVEKMGFAKVRDPETKKLVADRSTIIYNSRITLSGIPEEAYRYMLGSRSAIEWIIDRYQVKTDKASGIVNDPNDWSREVSDPRYIIDLLARIVTVSLETMKIVDALPALEIREDSA